MIGKGEEQETHPQIYMVNLSLGSRETVRTLGEKLREIGTERNRRYRAGKFWGIFTLGETLGNRKKRKRRLKS